MLAPNSTDRRCFVASALFGEDAPETEALRQFRDDVLARTTSGRIFIECYYRVSPPIARALSGSGWVKALSAQALKALIQLLLGFRK